MLSSKTLICEKNDTVYCVLQGTKEIMCNIHPVCWMSDWWFGGYLMAWICPACKYGNL